MTSTARKSDAFYDLVLSWAEKIARASGTTVEAILSHAENVRDALLALKPHGRKARELLALSSGLSRPMMSKLETIGRRSEPLRRRAQALPPSVSSLYALARKPEPEFERALMMDLRRKSRAEIAALFAPLSPPKPTRKLMTILVAPDLDEAARSVLMADIAAALSRITQDRNVDLDISVPAHMREASQGSGGQSAKTAKSGDAPCALASGPRHSSDETDPAAERMNDRKNDSAFDEGHEDITATPLHSGSRSMRRFRARRSAPAAAKAAAVLRPTGSTMPSLGNGHMQAGDSRRDVNFGSDSHGMPGATKKPGGSHHRALISL